MKRHVITGIERGSIAEELGIGAGDVLLDINGREVLDVFDYRYMVRNEVLTVLIESGGEEIEFELEKDEDEDLGLVFGSGLMDEPKSCRNKCVFCFVDQLPRGMRGTLRFKDDDMRLSFLKGNYVTLTNMSAEEMDRIIYYHLSPINVSVHATVPSVREKMLGNKNAGNILEQLRYLANNNIELNFQAVLCRGINDGDILDKTIADLSAFIPNAKSLSVVPVGITKERGTEGSRLFKLSPYDRESAAAVLSQVNAWQERLLERHGTRFVYAADEFYIKAGEDIPGYSEYEGFPQLENGVGMIALMRSEFLDYLKGIEPPVYEGGREITVVTGLAAYGFIKSLCAELESFCKGLRINAIPVQNKFFGEEITVSGLLTGADIIGRLTSEKGRLGGKLYIPANSLRAGEDVFLDDVTLGEMEKTLGIEVVPVSADGGDFAGKLLFDK